MANKQLTSKWRSNMSLNKKAVRTTGVFILVMTGMLGLSLMSRASAADSGDVKKVQETLRDKGYNPGPIDGVSGPQTRGAISQYQKSENLPVTGHLDTQTASKLGVEQESEGSDFKSAGKDVAKGGEGVGHEMKQGKPVAAGKDLGEGVGQAGKKVGEGVGEAGKKVGEGVGEAGKKVGEGAKKAVSPHSDSSDPEKKQ
jgi:peptidoglycan hydrolase-like protein with peptidoglycan-binding domain